LALAAKGADGKVVEAREGVPIEEPEVVAGGILAKIFRLDTRSASRAGSRRLRRGVPLIDRASYGAAWRLSRPAER